MILLLSCFPCQSPSGPVLILLLCAWGYNVDCLWASVRHFKSGVKNRGLFENIVGEVVVEVRRIRQPLDLLPKLHEAAQLVTASGYSYCLKQLVLYV